MLQLQTEITTRDRHVTLVLGGARSGKSRYGQQLASQAQRVTFLATAEARGDEEMQRKIERHQAERPAHWATIEEPLSLADALQNAGAHSDLILVDCLTLFAANLLEARGEDELALGTACEALYATLASPPCAIVLISNEVGNGVVPEYVSGRRFRDLVGELNQRIAEIADNVVLMIAGLPMALKRAPVTAVRR
jgi:adenosylcobinamide kinase / adenosylcobinamide-phosphate guanylyltransferase